MESIEILKYFLKIIEKSPLYGIFVNKRSLSMGWDGQIVEKVYEKL